MDTVSRPRAYFYTLSDALDPSFHARVTALSGRILYESRNPFLVRTGELEDNGDLLGLARYLRSIHTLRAHDDLVPDTLGHRRDLGCLDRLMESIPSSASSAGSGRPERFWGVVERLGWPSCEGLFSPRCRCGGCAKGPTAARLGMLRALSIREIEAFRRWAASCVEAAWPGILAAACEARESWGEAFFNPATGGIRAGALEAYAANTLARGRRGFESLLKDPAGVIGAQASTEELHAFGAEMNLHASFVVAIPERDGHTLVRARYYRETLARRIEQQAQAMETDSDSESRNESARVARAFARILAEGDLEEGPAFSDAIRLQYARSLLANDAEAASLMTQAAQALEHLSCYYLPSRDMGVEQALRGDQMADRLSL